MTPAAFDYSGLFITLEGGVGAGKTVQAQALAGRLQAQERTVVVTREPGGTPLGERLRQVLLSVTDEGAEGLSPLSEAVLFIAARAELVAGVIMPALERGDIVICDRFADSTRAYQGYGRGLDSDVIQQLNSVATQGLTPNLTVLLDLPVAEGLERAGAGGDADRIESEGEEFHARVRDGYLALAEQEPERWLVVDASQPPDQVTDAIWARVLELLA